MKHVATVVCLDTAVHEVSGSFSLLEVVAGIKVKQQTPEPTAPRLPTSIRVVSMWMRSDLKTPESGHYALKLRDDDGNLHDFEGLSELKIDLTQGELCRTMARVGKFPFLADGMSQIVVVAGDPEEPVGFFPFFVKLVPPSVEPATDP